METNFVKVQLSGESFWVSSNVNSLDKMVSDILSRFPMAVIVKQEAR